jgi:hypothetical protein
MRLVVVLAITACTESTEDRFHRFLADADIMCWQHECTDFPLPPRPWMSTDSGIACMNDALTSGARAVSSWSIDSFHSNSTSNTYVFTVDHQVSAFSFEQWDNGGDPDGFTESPGCDGPVRVGSVICDGPDPTTGATLPVNALAWDGCP